MGYCKTDLSGALNPRKPDLYEIMTRNDISHGKLNIPLEPSNHYDNRNHRNIKRIQKIQRKSIFRRNQVLERAKII